ncbi:hypothetical protein PsorP6_017455 [Peronosclerospora sorghi]|uniref:Uncharacterized protein n=1 Tax=Peronosclerospora sorghi TaxID=230839 RepID=A0ACC0WPE4_9STRA|nr:hypothetical protein PsorP6_017455 [Peronosclerospora sorghi]
MMHLYSLLVDPNTYLKGRFGTRSRAWHSISPSAQDLIRKLLEIDPDKRPSAEQALQNPWLRNQSQVSHETMKNSAEFLEKFQRGHRHLCASILAILLIDAMTENPEEDEKQELEKGTRFVSKSDLARVSESFGKHMSESELNEMLVGVSGDPEQNASSVEAIDYDNVKMTISTLQYATYRPGEAIIREGHAGAHNVYLLLDGEAEVTCKNLIKKVQPTNVTDEDVPSTNMSESRPSWSDVRSETSRARETKLQRFPKGEFFGDIDLVRPDGRVLPRIATYRFAERSNTPCKVLKLVADDFLNLQGTYDSIKARLEKTAHRHIEQHLL